MLKPRKKISFVYLFIDLLMVLASFSLPYLIKYNSFLGLTFQSAYLPNLFEYISIYFLWFILIVLAFKRRNLYITDRGLTIPREVWRVSISVVYSGIIIGFIIFFSKYEFFSREVYLESMALQVVLFSGWRAIKRLWLRDMISKGYHNINVLIVGAGRIGRTVAAEIKRRPCWGFKIVGFLEGNGDSLIDDIEVVGGAQDFPVIVKKYFVDEVIITLPLDSPRTLEIVKQAQLLHLGVRVVPNNLEEPLTILDISHLGIIPLLTYKERTHHPTDFVLKRFIDVVFSLVFIGLFWWVYVLIAILIKLDSSGPVLYVQRRCGRKGKKFDFYKFRSMGLNAEKLKASLMDKNEVKDGVIFKMRNDPRITKVGKFLRKYSLDELPQFFNVLKGDMSLVGPRPPTPDEVEKYTHEHMQRLSIRPGITGMSQIRGRSDLTFYRWVKWDIWYINNWSFWLDLRILASTIPAAIKAKGAY